MKFNFFLINILFILFFSSCEKEKDKPILNVNPSSLFFTQDNGEAYIVITNTGENELSWEIVNAPAWITVSKLNGQITTEADSILFTINTIELDLGEYSDEIIINSNGGNVKVKITLLIEHKIEIFPGIGAAKVELGDTYKRIKEIYGIPDYTLTAYYFSGYYAHFLYYKSVKATFTIKNLSSTVDDLDDVQNIAVQAPYDGMTEKLIGIGSSLDEVISAYGQPALIEDTIYRYKWIGIDFYFNEVNSIINQITVYNSETPHLKLYLTSDDNLSSYNPTGSSVTSTIYGGTSVMTFNNYFLTEDIVGTDYSFNLLCASTSTSNFSAVIKIGGQQVANTTFNVSSEYYTSYNIDVKGSDPNITGKAEVELIITISGSGVSTTSGIKYGGTSSYIKLPPLKSQSQ